MLDSRGKGTASDSVHPISIENTSSVFSGGGNPILPRNSGAQVFRGGLTQYAGGVYDCPHYGCGFAFHAVTMLGWGTDTRSGLQYWTARNSWGDNWGEDHLNPQVRYVHLPAHAALVLGSWGETMRDAGRNKER